jgi:hypothetical protein
MWVLHEVETPPWDFAAASDLARGLEVDLLREKEDKEGSRGD